MADAVRAGELDPETGVVDQMLERLKTGRVHARLGTHAAHMVDDAGAGQLHDLAQRRGVQFIDVDQELHVPAHRRDALRQRLHRRQPDATTKQHV